MQNSLHIFALFASTDNLKHFFLGLGLGLKNLGISELLETQFFFGVRNFHIQ
jgi:hypothetical protein